MFFKLIKSERLLQFYTIVLVNGTWCMSREHPAPQTFLGRSHASEGLCKVKDSLTVNNGWYLHLIPLHV